MRELWRSKHYILTLDDAVGILRRTRSAERFDAVAELEAEYADLLRAMRSIERARHAQLIDTRDAPPRNDPEFEAAVARHHEALYQGFCASAVLVQSAVGKLQVKRMLGSSGVEARVFTDEHEALDHLQKEVEAARARGPH
jgi:hypothetical protein